MCGLTGFIDLKEQLSKASAENIISSMTSMLQHRGPDDQGIWLDADQQIALGHRRLSILDISDRGHQPLMSHNNRFVIVFNGEVYNHLELRKQLDVNFHSQTDTETLVEAISAWGIEKTLEKINGMFAFAIWDRQEKELTLARDRLGIKPLYWGLQESSFCFSSELKSLTKLPLLDLKLNQKALHQYLQYAYVPAPHSIYQNIFKLNPGTTLTYKIGEQPTIKTYWSAQEKALEGSKKWSTLSDSREVVRTTETLLEDAVQLRLLADVPLGAFLSGGIDSSLIVALMQKASTKQVKTYSIGFEDAAYNEATYAKEIANHLGTDHTELYVSPDQTMAVIPKLADIYDEPFADSSQIPTFLVSQLARQEVTVALSGDGGDELFGGYNRYILANRYLSKIQNLPHPVRKILGHAFHTFTPNYWDKLAYMIPSQYRPRHFGDKVYKLANLLDHDNESDLYTSLVSCFRDPNDFLETAAQVDNASLENNLPDVMARMQLQDTLNYLPDDILTKVDRASMAVSLEARVPLLDYRLYEYAMSIPSSLKLQDGQTKWILRQILYKYVPKPLIERPKMGFAMPIDSWLRGPLSDWISDLLHDSTMGDYFKSSKVLEMLNAHNSGKRNFQHQLWALAMFQQWRSKWL